MQALRGISIQLLKMNNLFVTMIIPTDGTLVLRGISPEGTTAVWSIDHTYEAWCDFSGDNEKSRTIASLTDTYHEVIFSYREASLYNIFEKRINQLTIFNCQNCLKGLPSQVNEQGTSSISHHQYSSGIRLYRWIEFEPLKNLKHIPGYGDLKRIKFGSVKTIDGDIPPLKVLDYDIETFIPNMRKGYSKDHSDTIATIAFIFEGRKYFYCWHPDISIENTTGVPSPEGLNSVIITVFPNEKMMLCSFVDFVNINAHILSSYNGYSFDDKCISQRLKYHGISLRWMVDRYDHLAYIRGSYGLKGKYTDNSLGTVLTYEAPHLPKGDLSYSELNQLVLLFLREPFDVKTYTPLIAYNVRDVEGLKYLREKYRGDMEFIKMGSLTGLPVTSFITTEIRGKMKLYHLSSTKGGVPYIYLTALSEGMAPFNRVGKKEHYEGGYNRWIGEGNSDVGTFFEDVIVYDFNSEYPNAIIQGNLSFETYEPENATDDEVNTFHIVQDGELYTHRFYKPEIKKGFLPRIAKRFLDERDFWKSQMKKYPEGSIEYIRADSTQLAYKGLANSMSGLLGATPHSQMCISHAPIARVMTYLGRSNVKALRYLLTGDPEKREPLTNEDMEGMNFVSDVLDVVNTWDIEKYSILQFIRDIDTTPIYMDTDSVYASVNLRKFPEDEYPITMNSPSIVKLTDFVNSRFKHPVKVKLEVIVDKLNMCKKRQYVMYHDGHVEFKGAVKVRAEIIQRFHTNVMNRWARENTINRDIILEERDSIINQLRDSTSQGDFSLISKRIRITYANSTPEEDAQAKKNYGNSLPQVLEETGLTPKNQGLLASRQTKYIGHIITSMGFPPLDKLHTVRVKRWSNKKLQDTCNLNFIPVNLIESRGGELFFDKSPIEIDIDHYIKEIEEWMDNNIIRPPPKVNSPKPRGRPKKVTQSTTVKTEESKPPKPRGRPKKVTQSTTEIVR